MYKPYLDGQKFKPAFPYWIIRMEGCIEAKRRRYYRKVEKEKLRLAELGIDQIKIAAVCRYLCNFKNANTLKKALAEPDYQLSFVFSTI